MSFHLGELFCGPGGLGWGAVHAAVAGREDFVIQHAWANDMDSETCATYRYNLAQDDPNSVICADVHQLDIGRNTTYVGEWPEEEAGRLARAAHETPASVCLSMWQKDEVKKNRLCLS